MRPDSPVSPHAFYRYGKVPTRNYLEIYIQGLLTATVLPDGLRSLEERGVLSSVESRTKLRMADKTCCLCSGVWYKTDFSQIIPIITHQ